MWARGKGLSRVASARELGNFSRLFPEHAALSWPSPARARTAPRPQPSLHRADACRRSHRSSSSSRASPRTRTPSRDRSSSTTSVRSSTTRRSARCRGRRCSIRRRRRRWPADQSRTCRSRSTTRCPGRWWRRITCGTSRCTSWRRSCSSASSARPPCGRRPMIEHGTM